MLIRNPQTGTETDLPPALADLMAKHGWAASDDPIPQSHIPGVVPGISMNKLKKLVADGTIPHILRDRTKLIRPSDVKAALAEED